MLENEINRNTLARRVGVNALGCFAVAYLGWKDRHVVQEMIDSILWRKNSMPEAYENRFFKYHPEAVRVTLYFLSYQVKDLIDTITWNDDSSVFVVHHIISILSACGALNSGIAQFYTIFYFGFSELSTGILNLFVNFDDTAGVKGLGMAFPVVKIVLGVSFIFLFLVCRVVLWWAVTYYFCRDAWNALRGNDSRLEGRRNTLRFGIVSLSFMSLLQIIWLAEMVKIGKKEFQNIGLL